MKVHLSDLDYCTLFILELGPAVTVVDLQNRDARALARCAEHPIRLGLVDVVHVEGDLFAFSLTHRGCETVQSDEALAWFRRECESAHAAGRHPAEILSIR